MLLRRFIAHIRGENWFAVVLDLWVVVLGLFLGLQIDTWWEGRKEARLESAYLLEIREDFESNKASLQSSAAELEKILGDMVALLEQSALAAPELPVAELNEKLASVHSMPTFMPISRAYLNLTGSGDLRLIESRALKNALADYYAEAQLVGLVQSTHEMELVNTFQPYVIEHLDYAAVPPRRSADFLLPPPVEEALILEVLATREFRNVVAQKWNIAADLRELHRGMLKSTEDVLQLLE